MNNSTKSTQYITMINKALYQYIQTDGDEYDIVKDAMLYSLSAGGKRIRGMLVLDFCNSLGGDIKLALPFACAVEMVHCYSLIHDDLPCMDNDDLRRGKLSCHKKFGETMALLAGDALLTLAFDVMANACGEVGVMPDIACRSIAVLSKHAGINGMILGQTMDLLNENRECDTATLEKISILKTSGLISASCEIGVICSKNTTKGLYENAKEYGRELGLAFQIIDDILDETGDTRKIGKPSGSDKENKKSTFVSLYGIEQAEILAQKHTDLAIEYLTKVTDSNFLLKLTKQLLYREK